MFAVSSCLIRRACPVYRDPWWVLLGIKTENNHITTFQTRDIGKKLTVELLDRCHCLCLCQWLGDTPHKPHCCQSAMKHLQCMSMGALSESGLRRTNYRDKSEFIPSLSENSWLQSYFWRWEGRKVFPHFDLDPWLQDVQGSDSIDSIVIPKLYCRFMSLAVKNGLDWWCSEINCLWWKREWIPNKLVDTSLIMQYHPRPQLYVDFATGFFPKACIFKFKRLGKQRAGSSHFTVVGSFVNFLHI